MAARGDWAYTANGQIFVPDFEILEDDPSYIYVPLRGYSASLAVFDIKDKCIGWVNSRTLGYESAKDWMRGTKWIDQGY
jgi:hypothetical protein